jgi:hypothetical protein
LPADQTAIRRTALTTDERPLTPALLIAMTNGDCETVATSELSRRSSV